jgi:hypothetical protein
MSRTHVFLPCILPELESTRTEIWERPDENGRKGGRSRSVSQLPWKAKWEKPLAKWIMATGAGLLGPARQDFEWRGMMDGDASHPSEIRSLTVGTQVGLI